MPRPDQRPAHEEPGTIGKSVDGGVLVAAADRWLLIEAVQVDGRRLDPAMVLPHGRALLACRL